MLQNLCKKNAENYATHSIFPKNSYYSNALILEPIKSLFFWAPEQKFWDEVIPLPFPC